MDSEIADGPTWAMERGCDACEAVHKEGMGVISMKLIGEGVFNREDRQKRCGLPSRRRSGLLTWLQEHAEVDEAIEN